MSAQKQAGLCFLDIRTDKQAAEVLSKFLKHTTFSDSLARRTQLQAALKKIRQSGYWLAGFDSLIVRTDTLSAAFYLGQYFAHISLHVKDTFNFIPPKLYKKKGRNMEEVSNLEAEILKYAQNNGYPFAQTHLKALKISPRRTVLQLSFTPNARFTFDSLVLDTDSLIVKKSFLQRLVGFQTGAPFSQKKVDEAAEIIEKLPYLRLRTAPQVTFDEKKAIVRFSVEKVRAHEIDGFLGIFPKQGTAGGVEVGGKLRLHLHNLFSSGKEMALSWQRFRNQAQQLHVRYRHPFLFGSKVGLRLSVDFLQQDTTFSKAVRTLGLTYNLTAGSRITLFTQWLSHQKGATDEKNTGQIAPKTEEQIISGTYKSYGIDYLFERLNRQNSGQKSSLLQLKFQVGRKNIAQDSSLNIPQTLAVQYVLKLRMQKFFNLSRWNRLEIRHDAAALWSEYRFKNEFFRIGGLRTLRGFNEYAIFCSAYSILSVAYYSDFGDFSFFPFFDYARWQAGDKGLPNYGYGMGAGMKIDTKNGVFSVVYAVGERKNEPLKFNEAKIHFGYLGKF